MINIHLNGDIVRCPNISAIKAEIKNDNDNHCICRYGIKESVCETWSKSITAWHKWNDIKARCILSGCEVCPGHIKQKELGNKEKNFKIDNVTYRKLASTAHYIVKESNYKTLFITLTFGEFKNTLHNNYLLMTESEKKTFEDDTNKAFSKFVENLRTNYNCGGYIAVREFGHIGNRIHYHLLCSIPFVPFVKLNSAWCTAISDISFFSRNALTTDPRTKFIENPIRAMRYVCKYFSKAKGQRSRTRLVFVSNNILQRPKNMDAPIESVLDSFKFDWMKQTSDFTTCYRITDNKEFLRFCDEFLYPFFELSHKKNQYLYAFPDNTS